MTKTFTTLVSSPRRYDLGGRFGMNRSDYANCRVMHVSYMTRRSKSSSQSPSRPLGLGLMTDNKYIYRPVALLPRSGVCYESKVGRLDAALEVQLARRMAKMMRRMPITRAQVIQADETPMLHRTGAGERRWTFTKRLPVSLANPRSTKFLCW